jgi:uncharacterized protein YuzE
MKELGIIRYDSESDSLYVNVSAKKAFITLEWSPRIGIDLSKDNQVVGVEILDASKVISDLFHKAVTKEKTKKLLCKIDQKDALYLKFELGKDKAALIVPKPYKSPITQAK